MSVIGKLEPFEPGQSDWLLYTERLEQFFVANDIGEDKKKVATLLTAIGATGYSLLRNLVSPAKPADKSYDDLVKAMKDHLRPKRIVIAERFKFHRRSQNESETVAQYVAELRRLTEHCEFKDYLEEALRDRLVCGLKSETIQRKLLTEANLDLKKAYDIAHGMEMAFQQASELQASTRAAAKTDQIDKIEKVVDPPRRGRPCFRCGRQGHGPDRCYYKGQSCRKCHKRGHIAKMCQSQPGERVEYLETNGSDVESESGTPPFTINAVTREGGPRIMVEPMVNGRSLPMELDTGASVSIKSQEALTKFLPSTQPKPSDIILKTYSGERLKVVGEVDVSVEYGGHPRQTLPLVVVEGDGPVLLGRNWLVNLQLDWQGIKKVYTGVESLLQKYDELFRDELGTLKGITARLVVDENATPKFFKPRPVPYAIRGAIEQDLDRLESLGVLEKINHSEWAAPIVPVPKADGSIRICGDYKVTINPALQVDQFPMPRPEDLFATLTGGQKFSKLDLTHAYQQVLLHPESRPYLAINTHKGLYQYRRLPFGVASAPALFQQTMEKVLQGLPGVVVYIDDILVTGKTDEEHLENLTQVFSRLLEHGLRLKKSKCLLMCPSVEYLGYVVDAHGLHPVPSKVVAITKAPTPTSVKEVRSFLGLVGYYRKFIPNMSTIAQPLNQLLEQGRRWRWTDECKKSFEELKSALASSSVLTHYNPDLPLKLDCDASQFGLGAVISHVFPNGDERPVAYASRTLSASERNYSQIEKEALAIVFGTKRFHQYLYGRHFTLVTDHQPLLAILGPKRGLPTLAAARIQRWAITLAAYNYNVIYRSTLKHTNADGFSRLPLKDCQAEPDEAAALNIRQIEILPISFKQLQTATRVDPVLSKVVKYSQHGWPANVPEILKPYYHRKEGLSVELGCVLWGMRVVVPSVCRAAVLKELHTGHPGIVRMKSLSRIHMWWPGVDKDIEQMVHNCVSCQAIRNAPPAAVLHPWSWPDQPWKRIHIDFAGPFQGSMFLVVVDSHSKWLEMIPMTSTTTEKTLEALSTLFAAHGLPEQIVSDNGPQFTSAEFETCMKKNGIKHIRSAPGHPSSNGEAERFVQTFKRGLKASKHDGGSLQLRLDKFLFVYRSTPHATTGVSPAELFLKRNLRTRLDLLHPSVQTQVTEKQTKQKMYHDRGSRDCQFEQGQTVLVKNLRGLPKWLPGKVIERTGPLSYRVQVQGQIWRRHTDQLLATGESEKVTDSVPHESIDIEIPLSVTPTSEISEERTDSSESSEPIVSDTVSNESPVSPARVNRYPRRDRKVTERLICDY